MRATVFVFVAALGLAGLGVGLLGTTVRALAQESPAELAQRLRTLETSLRQMQAIVQQQAAEIERLKARLAPGMERQGESANGAAPPTPQAAPQDQERAQENGGQAGEGGLKAILSSAGIEAHGFVVGSFTASNRKDVGDGNERSSFQIDSVELDVTKQVGQRAAFRFDLDFLLQDSGSYKFDLEQAFMSLGLGAGVTMEVGKFNSPLGWEGLDAPDLYQFSLSNLTNLTIPSNLVGVNFLQQPRPWFDWQVFVVNGLDRNRDNNDAKSLGARLGFTPTKRVNFGVSSIYGAERDDNTGDQRWLLDFDYTIKPTEKLLVGGDLQYGREENHPFVGARRSGGDATWFAWLVTTRYEFTDRFGITLRFDYVNDDDGALAADFGAPLLSTPGGQVLKSVTFAPSFRLRDNLLGVFEYRHDWSSRATFLDRGGPGSQETRDSIALELTYTY